MLYLYAITESGEVPAHPGLRGASLRAIDTGGLSAIASEHEDLRLEPSEDDLWAHEEVVESLMDFGPVLPMRFGSTVADEAAVVDLLDRRGESLAQAIERVRETVEVSVRVALEREPGNRTADEPTSGTAYLMDRLEGERRQSEVTSRIHEPLSSLASASTAWSGEPGRRLWKAAYLVGKERLNEFTEQVDRLDGQLAGARVLCTGPWPPYSFIGTGEVGE